QTSSLVCDNAHHIGRQSESLAQEYPAAVHAEAESKSRLCSAGKANPDESDPPPLPRRGRHWSPTELERPHDGFAMTRLAPSLRFREHARALPVARAECLLSRRETAFRRAPVQSGRCDRSWRR